MCLSSPIFDTQKKKGCVRKRSLEL
jgi:hypothetical protein